MHNNLKTKYYFINKFDTNIIDQQDKYTIVIYRNYSKKVNELLILKLKKFCQKKNKRFFLSNNIKLAIKLGLDGVYLPSFNKNFNHMSYTLKKKFEIIGSAHNNREILIKEKQGCNIIFLSPIFKVKKKNSFLNIIKFNFLTLNKKIKFVALGGINNKNLNKLNLLNIYGYAGISYFQKKTAP